MLETQIILAIYAASPLYLRGDLASPTWVRLPSILKLPAGLRRDVRIGTIAGLALLVWVELASHSSALGRAECAAWLAVLVECPAFLKIAMHRDQGVYYQSSVEGAA